MRKELIEAIKQNNAKVFYKSTEWKKKRKAVLERDNDECQMCKQRGAYSKAECVHHVKHLKSVPLLALVDTNLLSLCYKCHNEVHPERYKINTIVKKVISSEKW